VTRRHRSRFERQGYGHHRINHTLRVYVDSPVQGEHCKDSSNSRPIARHPLHLDRRWVEGFDYLGGSADVLKELARPSTEGA
jgi:hypothetical protein